MLPLVSTRGSQADFDRLGDVLGEVVGKENLFLEDAGQIIVRERHFSEDFALLLPLDGPVGQEVAEVAFVYLSFRRLGG